MQEHLHAQLTGLKVTAANLGYIGSITLDPELTELAGLWPGQMVHIHSNRGAALQTYIIPGERGDGQVCLNGAAAHLIAPGDFITVTGTILARRPPVPRVLLVSQPGNVFSCWRQPPGPVPSRGLRSVMLAKLHRGVVNDVFIDGTAAVSLDQHILDLLRLRPGNLILLVSNTTGVRVWAPLIAAPAGSGQLGVRGQVARAIRGYEETILVAPTWSRHPIRNPRVILAGPDNTVAAWLGERANATPEEAIIAAP